MGSTGCVTYEFNIFWGQTYGRPADAIAAELVDLLPFQIQTCSLFAAF